MLSIPEPLWDQMLDAFEATAPELERVAYLDGIRWTDRHGHRHSVATTLTMPDAELAAGHYRVRGDAVSRAGEHLFTHGLVRLTQVHSHGDSWTGHSWVDDTRAYSQRDGALSIVMPYHARFRPRLADVGIHQRGPTGWTQLSPQEVTEALRLIPGLIDHRPRPIPDPGMTIRNPSRRRLWWTRESATGTRATSEDGSVRSTPTSRKWFGWSYRRS